MSTRDDPSQQGDPLDAREEEAELLSQRLIAGFNAILQRSSAENAGDLVPLIDGVDWKLRDAEEDVRGPALLLARTTAGVGVLLAGEAMLLGRSVRPIVEALADELPEDELMRRAERWLEWRLELAATNDAADAENPLIVDEPEFNRLTPLEKEVLIRIARGYSYQQLAQRLSISAKTVEAHVAAVLRKLQLSDQQELTEWASDRQIL